MGSGIGRSRSAGMLRRSPSASRRLVRSGVVAATHRRGHSLAPWMPRNVCSLSTLWAAPSPDGRYLGTADELEGPDGSELRFVLYDDTGNELGRTAVGVETDSASDEDVLERASNIVESLSKDLPVASVRKSILEAVQAPDRLPALSRFLVDNAGNLWVGSTVKGGRVVWRAWNIEGDLVRTWIADPDLELKQIHDSGAVAVRRDDVRGWRVVFVRPTTEENSQ